MRNDVSHAHPNYANMAKWTGTETTDIVYHDTTGYLTAMFIDRGYLLPTTEGAGAVTYYFEVKTTMGKHINFHLSRQQRALVSRVYPSCSSKRPSTTDLPCLLSKTRGRQ